MDDIFTNMNRTLARIDEIDRKCRSLSNMGRESSSMSEKTSSSVKERFVDLFDDALKIQKLDIEAQAAQSGPKLPGAALMALHTSSEWDKYIKKYAKKFGVDEDLARAVIKVESGNNPNARSGKGAMGLMQLMPSTARMLGVTDAYDPEQNIKGGIKYLSQLSEKYNGDITKTLAAYNAGPSRVDAAGGVPAIKETQNYVAKVLALYDEREE